MTLELVAGSINSTISSGARYALILSESCWVRRVLRGYELVGMNDMGELPVSVYFDFTCPYAYIAMTRLPR